MDGDEESDCRHLRVSMFVAVAESLGIRSILHIDYKSTRAKLSTHGLSSIQ